MESVKSKPRIFPQNPRKIKKLKFKPKFERWTPNYETERYKTMIFDSTRGFLMESSHIGPDVTSGFSEISQVFPRCCRQYRDGTYWRKL